MARTARCLGPPNSTGTPSNATVSGPRTAARMLVTVVVVIEIPRAQAAETVSRASQNCSKDMQSDWQTAAGVLARFAIRRDSPLSRCAAPRECGVAQRTSRENDAPSRAVPLRFLPSDHTVAIRAPGTPRRWELAPFPAMEVFRQESSRERLEVEPLIR